MADHQNRFYEVSSGQIHHDRFILVTGAIDFHQKNVGKD